MVDFANEVAGVVEEDSDTDVVLLIAMIAPTATDTTLLALCDRGWKQRVVVDGEDADKGFCSIKMGDGVAYACASW